MESPQVSVIMPARNAARFIAAAIDSVITQCFSRWELIVVDDGSEDDTAQIAGRYAALDTRIRLLRLPHRRLAEARNAGIRASSAPWVAFLDSDDLWHPEKLSRQVAISNSGIADLIFTGCRMFFSDEPPGRPSCQVSGSWSGAEMYRLLADRNRFAVSSVMVSREALDCSGLFDADPRCFGVEDYDLWLTLARNGIRFHGLPDLLTSYRVHEGSLSRNVRLMIESMHQVMLKHGLLEGAAGRRSLSRFAAILLLDEFFIDCRGGRLDSALRRLVDAWAWSPMTLCRPGRMAAICKWALVTNLLIRPSPPVLTLNQEQRRPAQQLIEP